MCVIGLMASSSRMPSRWRDDLVHPYPCTGTTAVGTGNDAGRARGGQAWPCRSRLCWAVLNSRYFRPKAGLYLSRSSLMAL